MGSKMKKGNKPVQQRALIIAVAIIANKYVCL
jgi:hypothetical protein